MYKESFIISCNTLLHVSTLLGHLQGELFCYRYTKVAKVKITKKFSLKMTQQVETCSSVLQLMIKLSLCICC
jgi:hypothetical protein